MTQEYRLTRREFAVGSVAVGTALTTAGCRGSEGGRRTEPAEPVLSYGDSVDGEITEESPRDPEYDDLAESFGFRRESGDIIKVTMQSEDFDTHILLANSARQFVKDAISTPGGSDSRLVQRLRAGGVYTIWAGSLTGKATGSFTLSFDRGAESDLIPGIATRISYGDTVTGQLTASAPVDPVYSDPGRPYTFDGTAGTAIRITMESDEFAPFPVVTDHNGTLLSQVEDNFDREVQVQTVLPLDGTYVIWAESARGTETGSFRLSLSEREDS